MASVFLLSFKVQFGSNRATESIETGRVTKHPQTYTHTHRPQISTDVNRTQNWCHWCPLVKDQKCNLCKRRKEKSLVLHESS